MTKNILSRKIQYYFFFFMACFSYTFIQTATAQGNSYQPEVICQEAAGQNYPEYHACFSELENAALAISDQRVQRKENSLCLQPQNGKRICFTNQRKEDDSSATERYYYFGTPPHLGDIAVIRYQSREYDFDEFSAYLFISLKNGQLLTHMPATAQQMAFSPDSRFLAAYNTFNVQYVPTLKIWRIDHSKNPQKWETEIHFIAPFASFSATGDDEASNAILSWTETQEVSLHRAEQQSTLSLRYICGNTELFYALDAQITERGITFSQSDDESEDNCKNPVWSISFTSNSEP